MSTIRNPDAYARGRELAIKRNAAKSRSDRFYAEYADAGRIHSFLTETGEFGGICKRCNCQWESHESNEECVYVTHPVILSACYGKGREIVSSLHDALMEWGALSPRQVELVRSMISRSEQRIAERAAAREQKLAADRAGSQHIGTVGERIVLTLSVERILTFEGQYGISYINLCRDASGNVVVYKGVNPLVSLDDQLPAQVTVKATVKAHSERDGVAQTLISRPKEVAA